MYATICTKIICWFKVTTALVNYFIINVTYEALFETRTNNVLIQLYFIFITTTTKELSNPQIIMLLEIHTKKMLACTYISIIIFD